MEPSTRTGKGRSPSSAAVVGVDHVEFLGRPDGAIEYGLGLRRDIAGAIRRLRPEVVFAMNFDPPGERAAT